MNSSDAISNTFLGFALLLLSSFCSQSSRQKKTFFRCWRRVTRLPRPWTGSKNSNPFLLDLLGNSGQPLGRAGPGARGGSGFAQNRPARPRTAASARSFGSCCADQGGHRGAGNGLGPVEDQLGNVNSRARLLGVLAGQILPWDFCDWQIWIGTFCVLLGSAELTSTRFSCRDRTRRFESGFSWNRRRWFLL